MSNIKRERVMLADEVEMTMDVEYFDNEAGDTEIEIDGAFCISGPARKEFAARIIALVDEFKI